MSYFYLDKTLAMEKMLDELGVRYRHKSGWQKISCPNPNHEDRHPSCGLHLSWGKFNCFSCGEKGDWADLALLARGWNVSTAAHELGLTKGADGSTSKQRLEDLDNPFLY